MTVPIIPVLVCYQVPVAIPQTHPWYQRTCRRQTYIQFHHITLVEHPQCIPVLVCVGTLRGHGGPRYRGGPVDTIFLKYYLICPRNRVVGIIGVGLQINPTSQLHSQLVAANASSVPIVIEHPYIIRPGLIDYIMADVRIIIRSPRMIVRQLTTAGIVKIHHRI